MIKKAILLFSLMVTAVVCQAQWSLDSCLAYAQQHNATLLAQAEAIKASSANRQVVSSGLLPQVNGKAEINHYWQIPVQAFPAELVGGAAGTFVPVRIGTPWAASYGAEASLDLLDPQTWQSVKLSRLQVQLQESKFHSGKQLLLKNVRMAYFQVQVEQENSGAMQRLYNSYQDIHRLLGLQFDKGIIDQITFNQSLTLLNDRAEAFSQAEVNLKASYLDLKFWMGYPMTDSLSVADELLTPVWQNHAFNVELLPDYEEHLLDQLQREQQWRVARARKFPTLSGVATYQRLAFRSSFDFLEGGDWFSTGLIGLRLNVPILSVGQMFYEPRQQKALWEQVSYQVKRYREEQEKTFRQENMQLDQAYQVWQNQDENLKLAGQNEALALQKIEKGIIDMVQLKQIQEDLYQVQQRLSNARLNYLRHYVELKYLQNIP